MSTSAVAAMERIYGFLANCERGQSLVNEWRLARAGLDVLVDYKQVANRLASAAATLADPESKGAEIEARKTIVECVNKLKSIRTDL